MTVHLAKSPEEAREILLKESPHVIISDLNMEPEDGYSFIQNLKEQRQFQKIPVIVLSAVNEFSKVKRVAALGINDYVVKPLQAPMLLRKLNKALFNKDFVTWKAARGEEPKINVKINVDIVDLGETGYRISGPFKLTRGKDLQIQVPEFSALGVSKCLQRPGRLMKVYLSGGNFLNDVIFIGIGEESTSKIRQFIRKEGSL